MQGRVYPLEWWKMGSPDYSACVANCWHQCWGDLRTITCVANCWHQYWGDLRAITCVANCWHQCWGDLRTITCVANCWHQCWGDLCTITVCRNPWAGHQALLALQCAEYEWYNTKQNRYIGYFFFFTHYYLHFLFSHTIICHANRHFQMFLPRHPPPLLSEMEQIQSMALPKLTFSDLLYENIFIPFYSSHSKYPTLADTNTPKQTYNLHSQILPSSYAFMWIKQTHPNEMSDQRGQQHKMFWPSNMYTKALCLTADHVTLCTQLYINITPQLPLLSLQHNESVSLWPRNATA